MNDDNSKPYHCRETEDRYLVVDGGGRTILESRDSATVEHYIDLLNKAFAAGYKTGYRAGRNSRTGQVS